MSQFFDPQDGVECNLGKMEDALALVHGLLFANVDEAWDGGLDEGAFRGAAHLVSDVRFAIRHFAQEIKKQEKLHEMPLQQCNGAASEEESRLLSDDELRDLPPFAKEEITEAREILHLYVGGEEKGLKNRALSYFAGSKKKVGRTDFLRVKELLETRRPTAQQSRVASGALSRDDLFAWVKSLILREIKAVEILTRLVEGKTEGLADMATAYLQDAAGESPPPLDPKIKELLETARTKTEA